jgi:pimeloyl-[acyl-carrier protein] synthase
MSVPALPSDFDHPFSPAGRTDPYSAYGWLRDNAPVYFDRFSGSWLVTSYADCAAALSDARFSAALGQRERVRADALPASMLTTDPPEHAHLRGPGALLLGPAALREITEGIAVSAAAVLDGLNGRGEADVTADIGEPFAALVLARLLQIPAGQRAAFTDLARRMSVNLDPLAGQEAATAGRAAAREFADYMDAHIAGMERAGADCPLTRLAHDRRLTRGEMLGILTLAVVGGFWPLADLAAHAVRWLAPRPDAYATLRESAEAGGTDQPGSIAERAVDELVRLAAPIPFAARVTKEAAELRGCVLPAASRVLLVIAAANRDPDVFTDPDEFDLNRRDSKHLGFGAGPHLCLGAPLVRRAGGILLGELARRLPKLVVESPVTWEPSLVPRRPHGQRVRLGS